MCCLLNVACCFYSLFYFDGVDELYDTTVVDESIFLHQLYGGYALRSQRFLFCHVVVN